MVAALNYSGGATGGRPPFDPVQMFKVLVIQAQKNLSDARTEFLISDRLSFMRFLGLGKGTMDLCIRTIGIVRAKVKIGLAHLTYSIRHLVYHERHAPAA